MNKDNFFSGKVFKKNEFGPKEPVQYGPLPPQKVLDPVKDLITKSLGYFPYQANGLSEPDLDSSEYLKS